MPTILHGRASDALVAPHSCSYTHLPVEPGKRGHYTEQATDWTVRCLNPGWDDIYLIHRSFNTIFILVFILVLYMGFLPENI
jgi:hypothetical protein